MTCKKCQERINNRRMTARTRFYSSVNRLRENGWREAKITNFDSPIGKCWRKDAKNYIMVCCVDDWGKFKFHKLRRLNIMEQI